MAKTTTARITLKTPHSMPKPEVAPLSPVYVNDFMLFVYATGREQRSISPRIISCRCAVTATRLSDTGKSCHMQAHPCNVTFVYAGGGFIDGEPFSDISKLECFVH